MAETEAINEEVQKRGICCLLSRVGLRPMEQRNIQN